MIIEYREIKPSRIKPLFSAKPKKPKHFKEPKLKDKTHKGDEYARSWKQR